MSSVQRLKTVSSLLLLALLFGVPFVIAWNTTNEFETAATNALVETTPLWDPAFTNEVHCFIQETTDEDARRTAVLLEVFCTEQNTPGVVLPVSSVLVCEMACSNLLYVATNGTLRWQDVEAASYWVEWKAVSGHPEQAFVLATNLLRSVSGQPCSTPSPAMQFGLERFYHMHDVGLLSPEQTFRMDAAASAALSGDWNAVSNLSASLPVPLQTYLFELHDDPF